MMLEITNITVKRLFTRMYSLVSVQMWCLRKGVITNVTFKRFFSRMHSYVPVQKLHVKKGFITYITFMCLFLFMSYFLYFLLWGWLFKPVFWYSKPFPSDSNAHEIKKLPVDEFFETTSDVFPYKCIPDTCREKWPKSLKVNRVNQITGKNQNSKNWKQIHIFQNVLKTYRVKNRKKTVYFSIGFNN
jgi:hypothetical protein